MRSKRLSNSSFSDSAFGEVLRFTINGLVATLVHFLVLSINLEILKMPSAGVANIIASVFGITASFMGNRYFVFKSRISPIRIQAVTFITLYFSIALIHGVFLFIWSDIYSLNYRLGFVGAALIQFTLSFIASKQLVFTK